MKTNLRGVRLRRTARRSHDKERIATKIGHGPPCPYKKNIEYFHSSWCSAASGAPQITLKKTMHFGTSAEAGVHYEYDCNWIPAKCVKYSAVLLDNT